jgi:hypothetical protein
MLPNESSDARVSRKDFVCAITKLIAGVRAEYIYVVLEVEGYLRLLLQNECYIILKHGRRVRPALG